MIRLLQVKDISQALQLSDILNQNFIEHTLNEQIDSDTDELSYTLWIHKLEDLENAKYAMQSIEVYHAPEIPLSANRAMPNININWSLTKILLGLCIVFFVLTAPAINTYLTNASQKSFGEKVLSSFLFDQPQAIDQLLEIANDTPNQVSIINQKTRQIEQGISVWKGYLYYLRTGNLSSTWFEKISQGQIWRLITPIFLHANIIHLFFNMLWLYFLGLQIERRIGIIKFINLVLISALVSNTLQYLISGYMFLGISGVISAFFGFIFARKKQAPWEAYRLDRQTSLFIIGYLLINLAIEIIQLAAAYFMISAFTIPIGTTAHLSGALFGWIIGSYNKFSSSI